MPEAEKKIDRNTEAFSSFRDELYKRQLSNSEAYDKAILSLSSAGLAISLTFIKFIVPLKEAVYLTLLKYSWILFFCSVAATLASFLISNKSISTHLKHAEQHYLDGKSEARNKFNIYAHINSFLNVSSGVLFLIALMCVVLFVTLNINQRDPDMSKGDKTSTTDAVHCEPTS